MNIQAYLHIIISDFDGTIVAYSDNIENGLIPKKKLLGTPLLTFISSLFPSAENLRNTILNNIQEGKSKQEIITVHKGDRYYYITVTVKDHHLYIQWEECDNDSLFTAELAKLTKVDNSDPEHLLSQTCTAISSFLSYPRVSALKLQDDGTAIILTEYADDSTQCLQGQIFGQGFFSEDQLITYAEHAYSYCPNLMHADANFVNAPGFDFPSKTPYPELPLKHRWYLQHIGIQSAVIFKMVVGGKLWGLIIAHNDEIAPINPSKRDLCALLVENSTAKMERMVIEQKKAMENIISTKLNHWTEAFSGPSLQMGELRSYLPEIATMVGADGVAAYRNGEVLIWGNLMEDLSLEEIVKFLSSQPKQPVFKDNNFRLKHGHRFSSKLPFAGLASLKLSEIEEHYVLFFRQEKVANYIDIKSSIGTDNEGIQPYIIENRLVGDTATPWDDNDLAFIWLLDRALKDAATERHKKQIRLKDDMIQTNIELGLLTGILAHDLKNPLSIAKMGTQILISKPNMKLEDQVKWLETMRGGIEDLEHLIKNTALLSQSKDYISRNQAIPMGNNLDRIFKEQQLLHDNPSCLLELKQLHPVCGDKNVLRLVFSNVLANAVKYTAEEASPVISITSHRAKKKVIYTISDNGLGIPSKDIPQVTKMFYRGENVRHKSGYGIGLSIVKALLHRMSGSLAIESVEGQGTIIHLHFDDACQ